MDLDMIKNFVNEHFESTVIDNFEAKLPEDVTGKISSGACKKFLNDCSIIFNEHGMFGSKVFFEPPVNNDYEFVFEKFAYTMAESDRDGGNAGFKLRTGGTTPELFPTSEQAAFALKTCSENKIKFKATAGLHHPIRHYSHSVSAKMHGFMNLFGAGILTYSNSLSLKEITEILNDENAGTFKFTDEEFRWNDISATAETVSKARNEFVLSFGSCSFDEPIEDLKKFNLL
jgi:hypothetical protein